MNSPSFKYRDNNFHNAFFENMRFYFCFDDACNGKRRCRGTKGKYPIYYIILKSLLDCHAFLASRQISWYFVYFRLYWPALVDYVVQQETYLWLPKGAAVLLLRKLEDTLTSVQLLEGQQKTSIKLKKDVWQVCELDRLLLESSRHGWTGRRWIQKGACCLFSITGAIDFFYTEKSRCYILLYNSIKWKKIERDCTMMLLFWLIFIRVCNKNCSTLLLLHVCYATTLISLLHCILYDKFWNAVA